MFKNHKEKVSALTDPTELVSHEPSSTRHRTWHPATSDPLPITSCHVLVAVDISFSEFESCEWVNQQATAIIIHTTNSKRQHNKLSPKLHLLLPLQFPSSILILFLILSHDSDRTGKELQLKLGFTFHRFNKVPFPVFQTISRIWLFLFFAYHLRIATFLQIPIVFHSIQHSIFADCEFEQVLSNIIL